MDKGLLLRGHSQEGIRAMPENIDLVYVWDSGVWECGYRKKK